MTMLTPKPFDLFCFCSSCFPGGFGAQRRRRPHCDRFPGGFGAQRRRRPRCDRFPSVCRPPHATRPVCRNHALPLPAVLATRTYTQSRHAVPGAPALFPTNVSCTRHGRPPSGNGGAPGFISFRRPPPPPQPASPDVASCTQHIPLPPLPSSLVLPTLGASFSHRCVWRNDARLHQPQRRSGPRLLCLLEGRGRQRPPRRRAHARGTGGREYLVVLAAIGDWSIWPPRARLID